MHAKLEITINLWEDKHQEYHKQPMVTKSLQRVIKKYAQIAQKMEDLKMQLPRDITTQILENKQVKRKMHLDGQLQMTTLFVQVRKPGEPTTPSSSTSDRQHLVEVGI